MTFDEMAPLVLWINLERRTDRRAEMEARLRAAGITGIRINAFDREQVPAWSPVHDRDEVRFPVHYDGPGYRACALSHLHCIETARFFKAPAVMIFEDDCQLWPGIADWMVGIAERCKDYDAINFGPWWQSPATVDDGTVGRGGVPLNSHCVLIRSRVYEIVAEGLRTFRASPDWNLSQLPIRLFGVTEARRPAQHASWSDCALVFMGRDGGRV